MIVDAFTYYNEADVLEIRLQELYPVVDKFILVEATRTHKGDEKPLYYATNRQRYAPYNDKIIHIVVGDLPEGDSQAAIWRREIGQRQAITRGLRDMDDATIVLISDLDEIPRRRAVQALSDGLPDDLIVTFDQTLYYYNVNTSCASLRWNGTRATCASNVRALTPDGVRWETLRPRSNEYPRHARMADAGWHLSYFGDVAHIQKKMQSFLHQELVSDANLDPDTIAHRMSEGLDVWGREREQQFTIGPASDLPWAMRSDPVKYLTYFHPNWRPEFHEDWYESGQAAYVGYLAQYAPEGAIVEIGCWEGKSTACIAQSVAPRELYCVDHWLGNGAEQDAKQQAHPSVGAAGERDVFGTYVRNMDMLTAGNYTTIHHDWRDWIDEWPRYMDDPRIAFLHLDAAHDYQSVYDCLEAVKPHLAPNAILCGDDYYGEGVYRAVNAALGERVHDLNGRLWAWQKTD